MEVLFPDWIFKTALFITFVFVLFRLRNYIRAAVLAFKLPGPTAYPLIGNAITVNNSKMLEYLGTNLYRLYGPIVRTWVAIIPLIFIIDPAHLQIILSNGRLTKKNMLYTLLHNFIGEGLITNNDSLGEKWKLHRKLIQPYFHINVLENFVSVFVETSNELVKHLSKVEEVNITSFINNWVLDTLHRGVLGIPMTDEDFRNSPFRKGELVVPYRISRPWMLLDFFFKFTKSSDNEKKQRTNLHEFTKKVLDSRKERGPTPSTNFISLLDMFISISDSDPNFTDQDIINETCTFMLAGQDSVGAATAFCLHFLAKHGEFQSKVYQEQMDIFEEDTRKATINDLNEMRYLEQCIKETMRLCPSVPMVCRVLNEDVNLGKYTIPSGTNLCICPFATHRLEYLYPEPLKYDPDRFSAQNIGNIHPFGYIPFSAGPRNCIGYKFALLEIKTVISSIIRNFHLSLLPKKDQLNISYRITLRAKGGIWVKLTKRAKEMRTFG